MKTRAGERGYALVAAVASILLFATIALTALSATQRAIVEGGADVDQARVAAAADAGIALAVHGLLSTDPSRRWSIDGRPHQLSFGDARLSIRIEDERGKIPLNLLDPQQLADLLQHLGLDGERLRIAQDSYQDWIDDDDDVAAEGAEAPYYRREGIRPRNGWLLSIGELGRIRGFDAALVDRLRGISTVHFGTGSFDVRFAQPMAIGIMYGGGEGNPQAIARARELDGQRTAFDIAGGADLIGRPLSIVVDARMPGGAQARRVAIIELSGSSSRPYVVRSFD